MWWFKKKRNRLDVRIISDVQSWTEVDTENLAGFLAGVTGKKLLAKLEHVIYTETITTDPMSDIKRGTIQGIILAVGGIRKLAMKHYDPFEGVDEDDDEDDQNHFEGL